MIFVVGILAAVVLAGVVLFIVRPENIRRDR